MRRIDIIEKKVRRDELMIVQQDYLFWRMIEQLVVHHSYRLVHMAEDQREVWLEPYAKKDVQFVRLMRFDIDWGNWLARDIEKATATFESVRKKSYKRTTNVLNIYVSSFAPVDEWEMHVDKPAQSGKTVMKSILITRDRLHDQIKLIEEALGVSLRNLDEIFEQNDLDYEALNGLKQSIITSVRKSMKQEQEIFEQGKPFFTKIFLTIQLVLFVLLEMFGGSTHTPTLIAFGAKVNELIYNGEWWRFVTPIFLHIGILHLLMNSLALYYIGMAVEKMYGSARFLFIYMFAGIVGTLSSFVFSPSISAGASGAIFGLFGALLLLGLLKPALFFRTIGPNILVVIGINLIIGFVIPNVDNAGHIGGLIGGFVAALVVQLPKVYRGGLRLLGAASSIMLLTGLLYYGFVILPSSNVDAAVSVSRNYLQQEKFQEAKELLVQVKQESEPTPELHYLLAIAELELGEVDKAKENLLEVVEVVPTYHPAYYLLSIAYYEQGERQKALQAIEEALKLDPNNTDYESLNLKLRSS